MSIKPGTDGALALGMMNVIIAEDLVDHDYVDKYTLGYDELKARAEKYPPERVASITGIPVGRYPQARPRICDHPALGHSRRRGHRTQPGGGDAIRPSAPFRHWSAPGGMWAAAPPKCRSGSSR